MRLIMNILEWILSWWPDYFTAWLIYSFIDRRDVLLKDLERTQLRFELLRRLKEDDGKPHRLGLLNICQGVIDEKTFMCGSPDPIEQDLKDLGVGLHMAYFPGDDQVIQQVKELVLSAHQRKRLG